MAARQPEAEILSPDGLFLAAIRDRDPAVQEIGRWFRADHLPPEALHCDVARSFQSFAIELLSVLEDSAELNLALHKLVEAKDWAVRAAMS